MKICLRRLLSLSIVLVFAAAFYNMSVCERAYAAKPDDGTTSGSGYENWDSTDSSSGSTGTGNVGSGKPWKSFGNDDIDETQHFLGTTDDNDIVIKTNNTEKARITAEGNVGIGTDAPTGTLHVEGGIAEGTTDGTDITIKAQDGGPDGGAGGNIVLKPGTGSGFVTDDDGNPVQATGEDGSPLFEEDENGNLVPVFIPNSGNVIIDGNLAPSSGHTITLGTPELRYSGIYLASWFKYDTDGLYFYYTADERTPKDYFHARFTVDATPYVGGDGWTYFDVDPERSGNFIISPDILFESPLGTEKLQVDGDVMSTGNVDAATFTGDGSLLTGSTQALTDEVFARTNADNALQADLDQEIADRIADVDAEETARLAAVAASDAAIATNAGNITQEIADRIADVNAEEAARLAAPASGITNAGSGLVITDSERTTLGTALQTETDPTVTLAKLEDLVVDFHTLGGVDVDTQLDAAGVTALETDPDFNASAASSITNAGSGLVITDSERTTLGTALQSFTELDPAFTGSAASAITDAGSNEVITVAERAALGTAVQTETDPTVTLAKLEDLVVDFHTLGGVDVDTQLDAAGVTALETDPDFNASAASSITNAGSGLVITDSERTTLGTALQSFTELDPAFTGSAASSITSAGSNEVITVAERAALGTAVQTETDPAFTASAASNITSAGSGVVMSAAERTTLGTALQAETDPSVPANLKDGVDWAEVSSIPADIADGDDIGIAVETDPAFTASAASNITSAGSGVVMSAAERTALGTALQAETDPTVTLAKLEGLVVDFHTLGGVDQVNDADADASNELNTGLSLNGNLLELTDAGATLSADLSSLTLGHFSDSGEAGGVDRTLGNRDNFDLGFLTNNLPRLHIQNDGKVGVGTTTPLAPFHVDTSVTWPTLPLLLDNSIEHKTGAGISMRKSRGTPLSKLIVNNDDFLGGIQLYGYDGDTYQLAANIRGVVDGVPGLGNMPGRLIFNTNDGTGIFERMRIDNSGNVGIGTDKPGSMLTVKGNAGFLDDNSKSRVEIESHTVTDPGAWIDVKNTSDTVLAYMGMDDGGATGFGTGFMGVGEGLVYPVGHDYEGEGIDRVHLGGNGHVIVNNSSGNGLVNVFANDWSALGPVEPYGFIELHDHNGNRDSSNNLLPPTITLNGDNGEINATRFVGDGSGLTGVSDPNVNQAGIEALGFVVGVHTKDTTLDQAGVEGLGFVTGPHTSDVDIAAMGYKKIEADPVFSSSASVNITAPQIANWDMAFVWGDHSAAGYLTTSPYTGSPAAGIDQATIDEWNAHTMDITDNTAAIDLNAVNIGLNTAAIAADVDKDASNELNTGLSLNGNLLELTDAGATLSADLSGLSLGDFSNLGEAGGADRTLGNRDNFDLGFLTNNLTRLHIQNDGKVGIGTASPVGKLDVNGVLNLLASGDSMQPGSLKLHSDNYLHLMGGTSGFKFYDDTGASEHIVIDNSGNVGIGTAATAERLTVNGNVVPSLTDAYSLGTAGNVWKDVYVGNDSLHIGDVKLSNTGGTLSWGDQPVSAWTPVSWGINYSSGNVRIGAPTSGSRLQVVNTIGSNDMGTYQHEAQMEIFGPGTKAMALGIMDNGIGMIQVKEMNVGYNSLCLNPIAGNVGVGTSSPTNHLTIQGLAGGAATDHAIRFSNPNHVQGYLGGDPVNHNSGALHLYQNGAANTLISANGDSYLMGGNVGIGTTSPTDKLTVAGNIVPSVTDTHTLGTSGNVWKDVYVGNSSLHIGGTTLSNVGGILQWNRLPLGIWSQNGTSAYYNNGKVGIGTTTPDPLATLEVAGQVKITGGTPGLGKVLTSDASGLATWEDAVSGGDPSYGSSAGSPTDAVYVANNGNVGIGTTVPGGTHALTVEQTQSQTSIGHSTLWLKANNAGRNEASIGFTVVNAAGDHGRAWVVATGNTDSHAGQLGIYTRIPNGTSQLLGYYQNEDGNVGIGTTTPATKFDVNGQIRIAGGTPGLGKVLTSDATGLATWEDAVTGGDPSYGSSATSPADAIFVNDSGEVGIGTATPNENLHVVGTMNLQQVGSGTSDMLRLTDSGGLNDMFTFKGDSSSQPLLVAGDPGRRLGFSGGDASDAHMTISTSGNVGIGTSVPGGLLGLKNGNTFLDVDGSDNLTFTDSVTGTKTLAELVGGGGLWDNATGGINYSSGNVGIGTTTPQSMLDIIGDVRIHESDILLRGGVDPNHGLGWYGEGKLFDGNNVDGPVLYGFTGGTLGTNQNGAQTQVLSWNSSGNVAIGRANPGARLHVASTPSSDNPNIIIGAEAPVSDQESASLTFAGWGMNHAGFGWVPSSTVENSKLNLAFGTNGDPGSNTARVTFQANGNVGIGTTSPGGLLGLKDANTFLDVDRSNNLTFTDAVSGTKTLAELVGGGITSESDPQVGTNTTSYVPRWNGSSLSTGSIRDTGAGYIGVGVAPNSNISIYGSGRGYGVYGAGSTYGLYGTGSYGVYGTGSSYGVWGNGSSVAVFGSTSGTSSSSKAIYGSSSYGYAGYFSGKVSIVDGTQGSGKVLTSDASGNATWQTPSSGGGGGFWNTATAGSGIEYSSGNVGIGTTWPQQKLHVVGTNSLDGAGVIVGANSNTSGNAVGISGIAGSGSAQVGTGGPTGVLGFSTVSGVGGKGVMGVSNDTTTGYAGYFQGRGYFSQNVGIGNFPVSSYKLYVNGDAAKTGGGSWSNYSDERLKTIIGNYDSGLEEVLKLQPISYHYNEDNPLGLPDEGTHIGFSAQEIQKVIPEAVTENSEGYLLVDNDPIMWTMLNAIKEQQTEIDGLKADNKTVMDENEQLKDELMAMKQRQESIENMLLALSKDQSKNRLAKIEQLMSDVVESSVH